MRLRLRDTELREDLIGVRVGLNVEVDVEGGLAVVGVDRLHVEHVVDAVHLLFERRGDGLLQCFCVGAGIGGLNLDLGWNDVGVLRDGQAQHRNKPMTTVRIAMTMATIGRRMKKFEHPVTSPTECWARAGCCLGGLGRDGHAFFEFLKIADDDARTRWRPEVMTQS